MVQGSTSRCHSGASTAPSGNPEPWGQGRPRPYRLPSRPRSWRGQQPPHQPTAVSAAHAANKRQHRPPQSLALPPRHSPWPSTHHARLAPKPTHPTASGGDGILCPRRSNFVTLRTYPLSQRPRTGGWVPPTPSQAWVRPWVFRRVWVWRVRAWPLRRRS